MQDLELMRNVTIGQYVPTGSVLHRLDPRIKIVGIGLLMIVLVAFLPASEVLAILAVTLGLVALSRVGVGYALRGLKPALPILLLLAGLQLVLGWGVRAGAGCQGLWDWGIFHVSTCSVQMFVASMARFAALILLTSLLTLTSSITELTHGAEGLMRPLQRVGFPAHELAMVFTLALRFVPTLAEELEKLIKAQVARGADIAMGNNPIQRTRHLLPILVPLFVTTLQRSEELIEAMEARGYTGGQGRSHYVRLRFSAADALALALVVAIVAGLVLIPFQALDGAWLSLLAHAAGH